MALHSCAATFHSRDTDSQITRSLNGRIFMTRIRQSKERPEAIFQVSAFFSVVLCRGTKNRKTGDEAKNKHCLASFIFGSPGVSAACGGRQVSVLPAACLPLVSCRHVQSPAESGSPPEGQTGWQCAQHHLSAEGKVLRQVSGRLSPDSASRRTRT